MDENDLIFKKIIKEEGKYIKEENSDAHKQAEQAEQKRAKDTLEEERQAKQAEQRHREFIQEMKNQGLYKYNDTNNYSDGKSR